MRTGTVLARRARVMRQVSRAEFKLSKRAYVVSNEHKAAAELRVECVVADLFKHKRCA